MNKEYGEQEMKNLSFMDKLIPGGLGKDEVLEVTIPTGQGKTTFTWQAAVAQALNKCHTLVMSFDPAETQLRIMTLTSGASRETVKSVLKGTGELSREEQDRYEANKPLIEEYLHIADFSMDPAAYESVTELLNKGVQICRHKDGTPLDISELDTVIIDWWDMVLNCIPALKGKRDTAESQLKEFNKEHGIRTAVTRQVSGKYGKNRDQSGDNYRDIWDHYMKASDMDCEDGSFILSLVKSRTKPQNKVPMVIDGRYGQWREQENPAA